MGRLLYLIKIRRTASMLSRYDYHIARGLVTMQYACSFRQTSGRISLCARDAIGNIHVIVELNLIGSLKISPIEATIIWKKI